VVERYDRRRIAGRRVLPIDSAGGEVHRVHQEDCCQALMVDPRNKYQRDGGPGMRQVMELLSGSGRPTEDRDRFMRACAFNFVIVGTDAHAKNYGLLLAAGGRYRLAPLYDIASWLPYSKDKRQDRLAMSVDRKYHLDELRPSHWRDEARRCGYSPDRAVAHIRDIIARLPDEAAALVKQCRADSVKTGAIAKLADLMIERVSTLAELYGAEVMVRDQVKLPGL
jgi:serine/threonine-protein kinase HipA